MEGLSMMQLSSSRRPSGKNTVNVQLSSEKQQQQQQQGH
jgi:hypothetical protein